MGLMLCSHDPLYLAFDGKGCVICNAVEAERERCAKIALSLCSDDTTQCEREGTGGCRARRISLMIRDCK